MTAEFQALMSKLVQPAASSSQQRQASPFKVPDASAIDGTFQSMVEEVDEITQLEMEIDSLKEKVRLKKALEKQKAKEQEQAGASGEESKSTPFDRPKEYRIRSPGPSNAPPASKVKEADQVKLEPLSGVTKFRNWWSHFRKEVAGASGQPALAFTWICEVENAPTFESLEDPGPFPTLDAKIGASFGKILHGGLGGQIEVLEEKAALEKKMIAGRQIAWTVY